jgi:hypothetical protein
MTKLSADQKEVVRRAHRLLELGTLDDLDEITILGGRVIDSDDIGVVVDNGGALEIAFFLRGDGTVSIDRPELRNRALRRMRKLMVLDDLADV